MHAVCKNPEKPHIWAPVMGENSLTLANYAYAALEEPEKCAKKCAAEKCVSFEQTVRIYRDYTECAPAHVQSAQAPCLFARINVAASCFHCQC
jgi:hypothetical protein